VVLADPDLLDLAFADVIASWEAEPPGPGDRTLVATSEWRRAQAGDSPIVELRLGWHRWLRVIYQPKVARSPPDKRGAESVRH
jgi:hypothetical protein